MTDRIPVALELGDVVMFVDGAWTAADSATFNLPRDERWAVEKVSSMEAEEEN
jgi:hypothetical protein